MVCARVEAVLIARKVHDIALCRLADWRCALTDVAALERVRLAIFCAHLGLADSDAAAALHRHTEAGPVDRKDLELVPLPVCRRCTRLWHTARE